MKNIMKIYKLLLLLVVGFSSCENNILDLESLTEPVDDVFYKNEEELNLALNGTYNSLRLTTDYKIPLMVAMDNGATDIGVSRGVCSAMMNQGQGTQSSTNGVFSQFTRIIIKVLPEQMHCWKIWYDPRMSCLKPYISRLKRRLCL